MTGEVAPNVNILTAIEPQLIAEETWSDAIDLAGSEEAIVLFQVGACDPLSMISMNCYESDTDTVGEGEDWDPITEAAYADVTSDTDHSQYVGQIKLGQGLRKRYLRVLISVTLGGGVGCQASVTVILAQPVHVVPVAANYAFLAWR
jgi:hypothetical protein